MWRIRNTWYTVRIEIKMKFQELQRKVNCYNDSEKRTKVLNLDRSLKDKVLASVVNMYLS